MDSPYMAAIIAFAGTFAPRDWALCNGQVVNIAQNTALYSLLGTTYGGNGQTTFQLPDFRGRAIIGTGQVSGAENYSLGYMKRVPLSVAPAGTNGVVLDTIAMNYCIATRGIYPPRND